MTCKDPAWMHFNTSDFDTSSFDLSSFDTNKSGFIPEGNDPQSGARKGEEEETFYPAGTECYRDPSQGSCFLFGNSGSGLVRQFNKSSPNQYAYTGPLSMSKSCDQIWILNNAIQYSSENPGVFTDAYCYLPWIAAMYGMKLSENYTSKASCGKTIGNRSNINLEDCMGQDVENLAKECQDNQKCKNKFNPTGLNLTAYGYYTSGRRFRKCDFTFKDGNGTVWDECKLESEEGYAYNIYTCRVSRPFFDYLNQFAFPRTLMGIHFRVPTTARESIRTL